MIRFAVIALAGACVSEPDRPCTAARPLTELNVGGDTQAQYSPALSEDRKTILWSTSSSGGRAGIWGANRADVTKPFSNLTELVPNMDSSSSCFDPIFNKDGTILFVSGDGEGGGNMYQTTFDAQSLTVGTPARVFPELTNVLHPSFNDDMTTVYFARYMGGGPDDHDLYAAHRTGSGTFQAAVPLDALNDAATNQAGPVISPDGSTLYFESQRYTTDSQDHVYVTHPPSFSSHDPYPGLPTSTTYYEDLGSIGPHNTITFESNRTGNADLWIACE